MSMDSDLQQQKIEKIEKPKYEKPKPIDKGILSMLAVVRRCRQEAEQFTAELLALEESDANSKEMDAMLPNILTRFFNRKAKYMRNFDDAPMQFINDISKAVVTKHRQFRMNEYARELMNMYDDQSASKSQRPSMLELSKDNDTSLEASGFVVKKQRFEEENRKLNEDSLQD